MVLGFGKKAPAGSDFTPAPVPNSDKDHSSLENEKDGIANVSSTGNDFGKGETTNVQLDEVDANREVNFLRKLHRWDPNLESEVRDGLDRAAANHDGGVENELIDLIENDSPYAEVRAAVRNYDEPAPANTVRAWVIGMLVVTIGSALNMVFSLRNPYIIISSFVAQVVAYPIGTGWDLIMPKRTFRTFGREWSLVPGPFNMKEHALITIMANVTFGGGAAYATDTILAVKAFYKHDFGWGFDLLVCLGTQMIGFGYAGMLRKYIVWPAAMMWPSNFVNTSLFYALHDHNPTDPAKANGWRIGRYKYFVLVMIGSFVWYWFPGKYILHQYDVSVNARG